MRLAILCALLLAAACGRKGDLIPPSQIKPEQPQAEQPQNDKDDGSF